MRENRVPGVAIALLESGKVVHLKGFGAADRLGRKVTPQIPFQIASVTKSFTSLIVLQLEREGKLRLNDSVTKYIPWFETSKLKQASKITIRNLLQHNSGLSTFAGNQTQNSVYRGADATQLAVKKLVGTKLVNEPGEGFNYSNANYHLATHLIELLESKPFEQVISERVLMPLEMKNSYVQIPVAESQEEAIGFPHWFGFPLERKFILGRMKMGDGGLSASAEDMAAYVAAVSETSARVISPEMKRKLLNPEFNNASYALGWEIWRLDGDDLFEHSGSNGGFASSIGFIEPSPEKNGIGFVILSNASSALYGDFVPNLRRVILDKDPLHAEPNTINLASLIVLYSGILVLVFFLYRAIFRQGAKTFRLRLLIAPTALLAFSYLNAFAIPLMNKISLLGIYPFFPDLAVGLIGNATLAFLLALMKMAHLIGLYKENEAEK